MASSKKASAIASAESKQETTALAVREAQELSSSDAVGMPTLDIEQVVAQVQLIQEVMSRVMKSGTHFGIIPGTGNRPTLYKPGAEKLLSTFRIAVKPLITDLSDMEAEPPLIRYRVECECTHQTTGLFLGTGIGECSSEEDKYAWRNSFCDEEWNETPAALRATKWQKQKVKVDKRTTQEVMVRSLKIHTNPYNQANTVLKMAKKRAEVDATLTILAASDIFAQDLEDIRGDVVDAVAAAMVEAEDAAAGVIDAEFTVPAVTVSEPAPAAAETSAAPPPEGKAAVPAATPAPAATSASAAVSPSGEPAATATEEANEEISTVSSGDIEYLAKLCNTLGFSEKTVSASLAKYGAKTFEELTQPQVVEIGVKLEQALKKQEAAAVAGSKA